jgi:hypothetical protein
MSNLDAINKQLTAATEALAKVDADLAWQATGVAADIAGTIDPTPVSDLVSAGVSVRNGDLWGAALSTVSMVPYLGDAVAKPVKAVRATKAIAGLTEKAAALRKTIADLTKAKKEAEAAAEITAKEAKIATRADITKDTATQQEKAAARKDKDREDCDQPKQRISKTSPPCFTTEFLDPAKADEFAKQLKGQEDALNKLTVKEYSDARAHFDKHKRAGKGKAQRDARKAYSKNLYAAELNENLKTMGPKAAKLAAENKTAEIMSKLAALHEPDLIAGGKDIVTKLGDRSVNSSIGTQWKTRIDSLDEAASKALKEGLGDSKMHAKLNICK